MNIHKKPRAFNRARKARQIWVDPEFKKFIDNEFPDGFYPEKTRRLVDRLMGYGKKK